MTRRRIVSILSSMIAAFGVAIACNQTFPNSGSNSSVGSPDAQTSGEQTESIGLLISAAASLQDAMAIIQVAYESVQPHVTITYNFGSSGALQQQIEQGAPVDVFFSAAPKQMNALEEKGLLLEGSRANVVKNSIVLVVPSRQTEITSLGDLRQDVVGKLAIGEPSSVSAGQYAQEVLTTLGLFDTLQPKYVFAKDVRQVLSYVETGNVEAGLVYSTDAQASDQVRVVATAPEGSHSPIVYPVAVLSESQHPEAAQDFVTYLLSEEANAIFTEFGFSPVSN